MGGGVGTMAPTANTPANQARPRTHCGTIIVIRAVHETIILLVIGRALETLEYARTTLIVGGAGLIVHRRTVGVVRRAAGNPDAEDKRQD
jgi:hypothetical protein